MSAHPGEKCFQRDICCTAFSWNSDLKKRVSAHTREKY